ncbi:MAG: hypothetical protein U0840_27655 [Gemmataceae bacterium]
MTSLVVVLCAVLGPADAHEKANPIFREMRQKGLDVGAETPIKFPAPLMKDGESDEAQQAILRKVIGEDFDYAEFTRNSPVAPNKLVLREVTPAGPMSVTRQVEATFVAHGNLDAIANKEFLSRVLDLNRKEGKAADLPEAKLKERGIEFQDRDHEGYGHIDFNLIEKVALKITGHSYWSKTEDSIIAVGVLDRRFQKDAEFPNEWRPILRAGGGKKTGKPSPYSGAAYYVKITRLAKPKGAVFVEGHILFAEPEGWFEGSNLLRAKLPAVIQNQVRTFRRELIKASEK